MQAIERLEAVGGMLADAAGLSRAIANTCSHYIDEPDDDAPIAHVLHVNKCKLRDARRVLRETIAQIREEQDKAAQARDAAIELLTELHYYVKTWQGGRRPNRMDCDRITQVIALLQGGEEDE